MVVSLKYIDEKVDIFNKTMLHFIDKCECAFENRCSGKHLKTFVGTNKYSLLRIHFNRAVSKNCKDVLNCLSIAMRKGCLYISSQIQANKMGFTEINMHAKRKMKVPLNLEEVNALRKVLFTTTKSIQ